MASSGGGVGLLGGCGGVSCDCLSGGEDDCEMFILVGLVNLLRVKIKMTKMPSCSCIGCQKTKVAQNTIRSCTSYQQWLVGHVSPCSWIDVSCPGQPGLKREFSKKKWGAKNA